ncbi:hypothetical protein J2129_000870 [Methanofollis sp. W23]|nr:hypothetical protein [Methanofollis sp. W23]
MKTLSLCNSMLNQNYFYDPKRVLIISTNKCNIRFCFFKMDFCRSPLDISLWQRGGRPLNPAPNPASQRIFVGVMPDDLEQIVFTH